MKNMIIHVGLHKTATKFFQADVFPKIPGWSYIPRYKYERQLLNALLYTDLQVFKKNIEHWRNFIIDKPGVGNNIIISNELFSGNPFFRYNNRYSTLKKLKWLFPEAKILLFIRGQRSIINSLYKEYIIQGGTKNYQSFVSGEIPSKRSIMSYEPGVDLNAFHYSHYIQAIQQEFGDENLMVLPYEMLLNDFNQVLLKLGMFTGKNLSQLTITTKRRHRSISDAYLKLFRITNKLYYSAFHHSGFLPHKYNISHYLRTLNHAKSKQTTNSKQANFKNIGYAQDNKLIDREFNLSLTDRYAEYYM